MTQLKSEPASWIQHSIVEHIQRHPMRASLAGLAVCRASSAKPSCEVEQPPKLFPDAHRRPLQSRGPVTSVGHPQTLTMVMRRVPSQPGKGPSAGASICA